MYSMNVNVSVEPLFSSKHDSLLETTGITGTGIFIVQSLIKIAAAGLVSVTASNTASARDEVPTRSAAIGVTGAVASGCHILSGECNGSRQSVAVRFGNPAERRELVVSAGTFVETTKGGYDRSFPVTHHGERLAALDFWLHGNLNVRGKTLAADKFFPIGDHGVLQVGGFIGQITGRAEAEAGAALTVVRPTLHYAVSKGHAAEQDANFGGVRQAIGAYIPLTPHIALLAQQHLAAGMDKGQAGLGLGVAYYADPSDRAAMRPDSSCGTQMQAAKGLVLSMQLCASELLYDKLGQKLDSKFAALASRVNNYTARAEQYGQTIPAVTGAPFARLVGYELQPQREHTVSITVAAPLGKATHLSVAVRRGSSQSNSTAFLAYQF